MTNSENKIKTKNDREIHMSTKSQTAMKMLSLKLSTIVPYVPISPHRKTCGCCLDVILSVHLSTSLMDPINPS